MICKPIDDHPKSRRLSKPRLSVTVSSWIFNELNFSPKMGTNLSIAIEHFGLCIDDIVQTWMWNARCTQGVCWCNHCSTCCRVDLQLPRMLTVDPALYKCQNMEVDRWEYVYSSSSAESIAGNNDYVGCTEVIEAEGVSSFLFLRERWESKERTQFRD